MITSYFGFIKSKPPFEVPEQVEEQKSEQPTHFFSQSNINPEDIIASKLFRS